MPMVSYIILYPAFHKSVSLIIGLLLSMFRHSLQTTPILFHNVTCNETHSVLMQCVDLHTIGVYDCDGSTTAGVSCPSASNTVTSSKLSNIHIAILGSVGTTAVAIGAIVIIGVAITLNILKMKKRR